MTTTYPAVIDEWTNQQDYVDVFYADLVNSLHERIIQVEQVLGINPQGASSTVSDRLAALEV